MNRVLRSARLLALAAALSGFIAGCASDPREGYSFKSTFSDDIRTVRVPIWDNTTFEPGLGPMLTEAISKEIITRTPWRVTDGNADTTLTGRISDIELDFLSVTPGTGLVQEQIVRITVRFEWRDARSGELLAARDQFSSAARFVPARPSGERLEIGERDAISELARDIVSVMRESW